jgi:hypothetical protein
MVRRVAMYWRVAMRHVDNAQAQGHLVKAWRVMTCGRHDLNEIVAGEWPMPPVRK